MPKQLPLFPGQVISLAQPPLQKAEDYLRAYNGYTYSAVSAIAQEVASVSLHLFKRKFVAGQPEIQEIFEHDSLSLIAYSNRLMTQYDLLEATQIYLDLVGEAFWVILRNGQLPAELWPVRPDWMKVNPSKTDVVDSYTYDPGGVATDAVKFKPEDVIHFKYFNPINPYRGKGSVQAAAMAIDTHTFAQQYNRNFFFNSALPGMVFTTEQKLSEIAIKRFMESWQNKFGGRNNSNKVAFLGGGFTVAPVTQTAKDMDFKAMQEMMRTDIMATFKVPKTILGISEDVNRANAEATTVSFMERVITPRMKKLVYTLNEFYLPNFQEDVFFDFDDPAPEDTTKKLSLYKSGLGGDNNTPWMTVNEVREAENMMPVEGGDIIYVGMGQVPLGAEPEPIEPNAGEEQDDEKEEGKDDKDKSLVQRLFGKKKQIKMQKVIQLKAHVQRDANGKRLKKPRKFMIPIPPLRPSALKEKRLKASVKNDLVSLIGNLMSNKNKKSKSVKQEEGSGWSEEKKQEHWKKLISKTDQWESEFKEILTPLFNDQEKEVITNVENAKHMVLSRMKGKESSFLFDIKTEVAKWVAVLIPFQREIVIEEGGDILEFLGVGGHIDTTSQDTIEFLREHGTELIESINETTRGELKRTLSEGITLGESIDRLKGRVEAVFVSARGYRAETIARSEVLRASNFATEEAYRQSEIVKKKEWLTAVDERVCAWCNSMDGKIVKVEESYFDKGDSLTIGGKTLSFDLFGVDYPPLHPSCRCTLIPVM